MEVTYRKEPKDLRLALNTLPFTDRLIARSVDFLSVGVIGIAPGLIWLMLNEHWRSIIALGILICMIFLVLKFQIRRMTREGFKTLPEQTIRIFPQWLEAQTETSWTRRRWDVVHQVKVARQGIVIGIDFWLWHVVPRRAFASDEQMREFGRLAQQYFEQARQTPNSGIELTVPSWFQLPPSLVEVSYQTTTEDVRRVLLKGGQTMDTSQTPPATTKQSGCRRMLAFLPAVVMIIFMVQYMVATRIVDRSVPVGLICLAWGVVFVVGGIMILQRLRCGVAARRVTLVGERMTTTISGCLMRSYGRLAFLHWTDVSAVAHNDETIFFKLRGNQYHVIPKRDFTTTYGADQFFQQCAEFWLAAQNNDSDANAVPAVLVETGNPYQAPRTQ